MATDRKNILAGVRTVVVKLGTQLLTTPDARLDAKYLGTVAAQVAALRDRGIIATIVSSGAIGAGLAELGLAKRPNDLARLQAIAAVGQRRLMDAWADAFRPFTLPVAQLLLTREDVDDRTRFLNVRNTINAAHELGAVPIINENDTISTDELVRITFGDNDLLAAAVASALRADLLVLLTNVDGLLDDHGERVSLVESVGQARSLVREEKSALGKGGMDSKLAAAKLMIDHGEAMIVAAGRTTDVLLKVLDGEDLGTLFIAAGAKKRPSRSRWIGAARAAGSVLVDEGAVKALVEKGRSLLPAGVVKVEGVFAIGDVIEVRGPDGAIIARGLSNYSSSDIDRIRGKRTAQIKEILGVGAYEEIVHRNNLVIC